MSWYHPTTRNTTFEHDENKTKPDLEVRRDHLNLVAEVDDLGMGCSVHDSSFRVDVVFVVVVDLVPGHFDLRDLEYRNLVEELMVLAREKYHPLL